VLNNGDTNAIPYLSLRVSTNKNIGYIGVNKQTSEILRQDHVSNDLSLIVSVQWPTIGRLGSGSVTTREADIQEAFLQLPTPGSYELDYLPGTTTLSYGSTHFFHYLPDGIMGSGIALQDVGEPPNCYPCDIKYIRVVRFEARVVTGRTA
jgi:hypothetical protein